MQTTVNRVVLLGHIEVEPSLTYTQNATALLRLTVVTADAYTDQHGALRQKLERHNVVLWGAAAEFTRPLVDRGDRVLVQGRVGTATWVKAGQRCFAAEITADSVIVLDSRADAQHADANDRAAAVNQGRMPFTSIDVLE